MSLIIPLILTAESLLSCILFIVDKVAIAFRYTNEIGWHFLNESDNMNRWTGVILRLCCSRKYCKKDSAWSNVNDGICREEI